MASQGLAIACEGPYPRVASARKSVIYPCECGDDDVGPVPVGVYVLKVGNTGPSRLNHFLEITQRYGLASGARERGGLKVLVVWIHA